MWKCAWKTRDGLTQLNIFLRFLHLALGGVRSGVIPEKSCRGQILFVVETRPRGLRLSGGRAHPGFPNLSEPPPTRRCRKHTKYAPEQAVVRQSRNANQRGTKAERQPGRRTGGEVTPACTFLPGSRVCSPRIPESAWRGFIGIGRQPQVAIGGCRWGLRGPFEAIRLHFLGAAGRGNGAGTGGSAHIKAGQGRRQKAQDCADSCI
jgi:hypothetical protein